MSRPAKAPAVGQPFAELCDSQKGRKSKFSGSGDPSNWSLTDTTVPKAVMFPTDANLINRARERLARQAKRHLFLEDDCIAHHRTSQSRTATKHAAGVAQQRLFRRSGSRLAADFSFAGRPILMDEHIGSHHAEEQQNDPARENPHDALLALVACHIVIVLTGHGSHLVVGVATTALLPLADLGRYNSRGCCLGNRELCFAKGCLDRAVAAFTCDVLFRSASCQAC